MEDQAVVDLGHRCHLLLLVDGPAMTEPAKQGKWAGRQVSNARAYWAPRLPLPCYQCGGMVASTTPWVVEHVIPRSQGGNPTLRSNQWVSHKPCSDSSGGQMGAVITHARRPATIVRMDSNAERNIRGI